MRGRSRANHSCDVEGYSANCRPSVTIVSTAVIASAFSANSAISGIPRNTRPKRERGRAANAICTVQPASAIPVACSALRA